MRGTTQDASAGEASGADATASGVAVPEVREQDKAEAARGDGPWWRLHTGDCRDVMADLDAASVDAVVTDPPYGLGFMGQAWDRAVPGPEFFRAMLRVAKPGSHLVAFGGTRLYHRMTCAIEDAGWEVRDCLMWLYGTGFPKSHNGDWGGTALKPAWEPIVLARKPLDGTVAANFAAHGVGGLDIDGCRVGTEVRHNPSCRSAAGVAKVMTPSGETDGRWAAGRWPANLMLDENAAAELDAQAGDWGDSGGASRFFYRPKADRAERDEGIDASHAAMRNDGRASEIDNPFQRGKVLRNHHPTVKPTELMRWLVRLVTPEGGLVLDPFCGSGSTGRGCVLEGRRFIGIEREREYVEIARSRITAAAESVGLFAGLV